MEAIGPALLGYTPPPEGEDSSDCGAWQSLPRHKDEDQVRLDVDRSFIYYPKSRYHLLVRPRDTG